MVKFLKMKRVIVSLMALFFLLQLFSCVSATKFFGDGNDLKSDEGILLVRIINPDAGKTRYAETPTGEKAKNVPEVKTNSDISIASVPFCVTPYMIRNDEAPVQLAMVKIKKGLYVVNHIGKNCTYPQNEHTFRVSAGAVNYLGDYLINYIQDVTVIMLPPYTQEKIESAEWYTLKVEDHYDELIPALEKAGYFSETGLFSNLTSVNISRPTKKTLWPFSCPKSRPKDLD